MKLGKCSRCCCENEKGFSVKKIKKLLCVALALIMTMSLCVPAFAADDVVSRTNNGSLHGTDDGEILGETDKDEELDEPDEEEPDEEEDKEPDREFENICSNVGDLLQNDDHIAYINGFDGGTFAPNRNITRAQAATMFYNLLREKPEGSVSFPDVAEGSWAEEAIGALAYLGAIKGLPDGSFNPNAMMTREQFVTIATRFSSMKDGSNTFSDVEKGCWSEMYIISACAYGWIDGFENGTFKPKANITRAQAVKIINGMLERECDSNAENIRFTKRFSDVKPDHWAFSVICEAATEHLHTHSNSGKEVWLVQENDVSHWVEQLIEDEDGLVTGKEMQYFNAFEQELVSGFFWVDDRSYYFDPETNYMLTGWLNIDGYDYLLPDRSTQLFPFEIGQYLTKVNYREANRTAEDIKYITVHYTAVPGDTAYGECSAFYNTYRAASAQYFVDEKSVWQCVKDKDVSWHVGNNVYYHDEARNENTIGIEMCCRKVNTSTMSAYDKDWYFLGGTLENSANLARGLMMKYGVPIQNVIRHSDVTRKVCPAMFVWDYSNWVDYIKRVTKHEIDYSGEYDVRITADNVAVRSGPDTTYPVVRKLSKNEIVTLTEERLTKNTYEGRWGKIGDNQWVNFPYISRQ